MINLNCNFENEEDYKNMLSEDFPQNIEFLKEDKLNKLKNLISYMMDDDWFDLNK